jgi:hypothetical protein
MKLVVFLPIIIFFGIFFVLVLGFIGLVIKLLWSGRNQAWEGVVVDKIYNQKREDKKMHSFYSLAIKVDGVGERKIAVGSEFYNRVKVGDRLRKEKGKMWPEKI